MQGDLVSKLNRITLTGTRPLLDRRWFQLACGLILAIALPAYVVLYFWPSEALGFRGFYVSAVASAIAFLTGLLWYRRMVRHPGIHNLENVLSAFVGTYSLAGVVVLLARLDYSRTFLFSAFLLTSIGFALLSARRSSIMPNFLLVPFGHFERAQALNEARWDVMREPKVPAKPGWGIVADLRADLPSDWQSMLADAVLAGVPVFHVKQIEEALTGRIDIEHMSENQFGSLVPNLGYRRMKSLADFAIALLIAPLLLPFFLLVALLIKIESPGPVFFLQKRMGYRGRAFSVIKFRSMKPEVAGAEHDPRIAAMTQTSDERITRVGKFIRRYRIDELPQVFNVLRGEMSWIGPRPEALPLSHWYRQELPFYQYRHAVKPGLTGWAQVNQGHVANLSEVHDKLRYDFYYIKYFSIWLDTLIVIRTARIIVGGFGSK